MILLLRALLGPFAYFHREGEGTGTTGGAPAPAIQASSAPAASAPAPVTPPASAPGTTPPAAASSTATQPADDLQAGNWKAMRERLNTAEQKAALLSNIEGLDEAQLPVAWKQYTAMTTELRSLGAELGYTDAELKEAIDADPVHALSVLRGEKTRVAATQTPKPGESRIDYEARIRDEVAKQTKPFTEHINKQLSDAVQAKIGEEFTKSFEAALPNTPPEVKSLVQDYLEGYLASPEARNHLVAMKARGDYSAVDSVVKTVAGRLQDVFTKWVAHETTRTGGRSAALPTTPGAQGSTRRGPTLDEIINDPGVLGEQYR